MIATLAQAPGATLIGRGVTHWLARQAEKCGLLAVPTGRLVVQILSLIVVLPTMQLGGGIAVAPGVVIHVAFGSLYGLSLLKARKP